jgi:hypothetical protein
MRTIHSGDIADICKLGDQIHKLTKVRVDAIKVAKSLLKANK